MNKKTNSIMKQIITTALSLLFFCQAATALAERTTTYLHTDGLGSVVAASDEDGNVMWRKSYAPYGKQIDEQEDDQKLSYTGKPHDEDLGLTYFGARWYDPQAGRFTGIDPVGFVESSPQSFNRYAYANNNPYRYVDPDGRIPVETVWDIANIGMGVASLGKNIAIGNYAGATLDAGGIVLDTAATFIPYMPGGAGTAIKAKRAKDALQDATSVTTKSDDVIHVTKDGVALTADPKYKIPDSYVQNPHRSGSYGEIVDGKFKEL